MRSAGRPPVRSGIAGCIGRVWRVPRLRRDLEGGGLALANELKARELDLKTARTAAEVKEIEARAVQVGVQAAFAAMQAGAQIAQAPVVAPLADIVMQTAGYRPPDPPGQDPNFAVPPGAAPEAVAAATPPLVQPPPQNTSPTFPAKPRQGGSGMGGIETAKTADNLPKGEPMDSST